MLPRALVLALLVIAAATGARAQSPRIDVVEGRGRVVMLPRDAASLFVGDASVADVQAVSARSLYVVGVTPGTTNLLALDFADELIAQYSVRVLADNDPAAATLDELAPRGSVDLRQNGDLAILRGQASDVGEALAALDARRALDALGRETLDRTTIGGGVQVSLRVRFLEVSRTELTRLGLDVSAFSNPQTLARAVTRLSAGGGGLDALARGSVGDVNIEGVLDALESRDVIETLSEPVLTTTSGKRATFRAGGEFVVPVPQGDDGITAEFREFGVSVDFLPTVLPNGRIAVEVAPEVSSLDTSAAVSTQVAEFTIPGLTISQAQTTVEVGSGQTFAIAGLYQLQGTNSESTVPGARRIRGLRAVLGERQQVRDERELVILVTPTLVEATDVVDRRPVAPADVADTVGFILK